MLWALGQRSSKVQGFGKVVVGWERMLHAIFFFLVFAPGEIHLIVTPELCDIAVFHSTGFYTENMMQTSWGTSSYHGNLRLWFGK